MKNVLNFIKKHDNIFVFIVLLIITSTFAFSIKLDANDSLWNFSNIYKMTNSYTIYKDLNVIITPLYFYVGNIIFEIFGANYLIYSIYQNIVIYIMLFFLIYKLFKKVNISKVNSILYIIIISITTVFILPEASYNMLAIFFVLLGIYNLINKKENKLIINILQGSIAFLVFLTKQNIGVLYLAGIILAQILIEKNKKILIKNILEQILTQIILTLILLGYMYINGNLYDFINFAFLGISEFANKNLHINVLEIIINIFTFSLSILTIVLAYIKKIPFKDKEKTNLRILGTVSIFMTFIAYPLMNTAHTLIANIMFMVMLCYLLDLMIMKEFFDNKKSNKIKKVLLFILIIIVFFASIYNNYIYIKEINSNNYCFLKENPYYGAIADKEIIDEIRETCNYIKEQNKNNIDVKIVSCYSNLYMNLLGKNNKILDLPFYGNMGIEGEDGLIEEIKNMKNTKILVITNIEGKHGQESEKVINFVKENFEYEGNICRFSTYNVK